jgi:hypothetical protein
MGARFKADQNKVMLLYESGTYSVKSGNAYWIGQVTENAIDDKEGLIEDRFLGTSNRSYSSMTAGPRDVEGTISYYPQDMNLVFHTLGSVFSVHAAKTGTHTATQINTNSWQNPFASGTGAFNNPISFTIEDSKTSPVTGRNSIRTVNGCVPNKVTLTASQGEKVKVELDWIGQNLTYTSGATTATTNVTQSGITPYLWNNCTLTIAGSNISTAKEVSLEIDNSLEGPHYINGSRVIGAPIVGNRNITLNVTMDWESDNAVALYESLYKGNASFNTVFDMNADVTATGSLHTTFTLSGCKITSLELPSTNEGITEASLEIRPQNISAIEYSIGSSYTPW